jgi:hypothetical protein
VDGDAVRYEFAHPGFARDFARLNGVPTEDA